MYSEKDGIGGSIVVGETLSAASASKTTLLLVFSLFVPADNVIDGVGNSEEQFACEAR